MQLTLVVTPASQPCSVSSPLSLLSPTAVDPSGHTWQRYTDQLVHVAVAALPWAAAELSESHAGELGKLMDGVQTYLVSYAYLCRL